jgi:hypothetical protein
LHWKVVIFLPDLQGKEADEVLCRIGSGSAENQHQPQIFLSRQALQRRHQHERLVKDVRLEGGESELGNRVQKRLQFREIPEHAYSHVR